MATTCTRKILEFAREINVRTAFVAQGRYGLDARWRNPRLETVKTKTLPLPQRAVSHGRRGHNPEHPSRKAISSSRRGSTRRRSRTTALRKTSPSSPCSNTRARWSPTSRRRPSRRGTSPATGGNAGQDAVQRRPGRLSRRAWGRQPQQVHGGAIEQHQSAAVHEPVHAVGDQFDPADHAAELGLQQNQQQNAANSANAFGGSRQAIQQGVTQAQGAQNMAQMAAQLNQANFAQAQTGAQGDIANNLQAQLANQAAQQNQGNLNLRRRAAWARSATRRSSTRRAISPSR